MSTQETLRPSHARHDLAAPIALELVEAENDAARSMLDEDFDALGARLARRGIDIEAICSRVSALELALPSWGVGVGGTRFARFPIPGEPTSLDEKLEDCAVVQQLGRQTPRVSLHFPWDKVADPAALADHAATLGLGFDAVNSNTFQDQPDSAVSYKYGSLSHSDPAVRREAVAHNIECIAIGERLGSKAITVWVGDGSNFPGQQSLSASFDRYLESAAEIYAALPSDWRMLLEHKLYEPAFYSTVISDWGTSLMAAQSLGPQACCLIDLGHHAPSVNIEQIVARLHRAGRLGGFHFNDSKYGDDDLDSGSIDPHRLFLVFNELVEAEQRRRDGPAPAYMMDQSHNVTDPIESLLASAEAIAVALAQALVVDRAALETYQQSNDAMMAFRTLREGFATDVRPIVAMARLRAGGAIDPIRTYRASGWRERASRHRAAAAAGAGIV